LKLQHDQMGSMIICDITKIVAEGIAKCAYFPVKSETSTSNEKGYQTSEEYNHIKSAKI